MAGFDVQHIALHEKLRRLAREAGEHPLTMGEGLQRLSEGGSGFGVALLLLSLPAALPIPTSFGLKSLVGVMVTLLGFQMLVGKHSMWLPQWFTRVRLRADWSRHAARFGVRYLPSIEGFVKQRMNWMLSSPPGVSLLGLAVIFLGLVMMISIIPGSSIAAALILLALSVGLIESDGGLTLLAAVAALVLVALHAEVIYLLVIWLAD